MFYPINRYGILGFILLVLGFFTLPILIGFILMPIGCLLLCYGAMLSIWEMLPGHSKLEPKIKEFKDQYIESSPILTKIFGKRSQRKPDFRE
jgi:hypothetical protein